MSSRTQQIRQLSLQNEDNTENKKTAYYFLDVQPSTSTSSAMKVVSPEDHTHDADQLLATVEGNGDYLILPLDDKA